jgi:SAM-dependent methyltransferase
MTFNAYSQYYDLLYQDKDYLRESGYIESLIKRYNPSTLRILELGCGTGKHATLLAEKGYQITGVEVSESMLQQAQIRATLKDTESKGLFEVLAGDARFVRLNQTVDTVISLFHVLSYQSSNTDVEKMFSTAAFHLTAGGIFIFDFWYGPAVLDERPSVRIKRMENEVLKILRIAEPTLSTVKNTVNVHYTVQCTDKKTGEITTLAEDHLMRYFFLPELCLFADKAGFSILNSEEWLTGNAPNSDTWGVTVIAQKQ